MCFSIHFLLHANVGGFKLIGWLSFKFMGIKGGGLEFGRMGLGNLAENF
jgi:hypothetical protein